MEIIMFLIIIGVVVSLAVFIVKVLEKPEKKKEFSLSPEDILLIQKDFLKDNKEVRTQQITIQQEKTLENNIDDIGIEMVTVVSQDIPNVLEVPTIRDSSDNKKVTVSLDQQETADNTPASKRKIFWGGYITAGLIWTFAQSFKKNTIDEFIILAIAILAGVFYHSLKSKIKVKNEIAKIIITFFILEIIAGGLIGFLTSLVDNFIYIL